jgi:hypothetical protein
LVCLKTCFHETKVLPHLMDILHHHLERNDNSAAASLLMLFTKIARDESRTRAIFMMRLFPRWKEVFDSNDGEGVRMPRQHEGTTGKLIIDAMQSSNTGLQFYANEFVFLLCNENAGAFTKFVGFGPAAGHLAVRGLMNMGSVKSNPLLCFVFFFFFFVNATKKIKETVLKLALQQLLKPVARTESE